MLMTPSCSQGIRKVKRQKPTKSRTISPGLLSISQKGAPTRHPGAFPSYSSSLLTLEQSISKFLAVNPLQFCYIPRAVLFSIAVLTAITLVLKVFFPMAPCDTCFLGQGKNSSKLKLRTGAMPHLEGPPVTSELPVISEVAMSHKIPIMLKCCLSSRLMEKILIRQNEPRGMVPNLAVLVLITVTLDKSVHSFPICRPVFSYSCTLVFLPVK